MYAKLFASLYQGTLRGCADEILVFTNLLAHADSFGMVDKHWRAIAEETGISRERVEKAIANLEASDPDSRSPEEEGRRIVKMDEHRVWGWRIVNYGKYRSIRSEDDRREQNRKAQERWRERKQNKPRKPRSAQAEAEAEAEATSRKESESAPARRPHNGAQHGRSGTRIPDPWRPNEAGRAFAQDKGLDPEETANAFCDYWTAAEGRTAIKRDWNAAFRTWCRRDADSRVGRPRSPAIRPARGNDALFEHLAHIAHRDRKPGEGNDG